MSEYFGPLRTIARDNITMGHVLAVGAVQSQLMGCLSIGDAAAAGLLCQQCSTMLDPYKLSIIFARTRLAGHQSLAAAQRRGGPPVS